VSEGTEQMTDFSPDAPADEPQDVPEVTGGLADEGAPVPGAAPAPAPAAAEPADLEPVVRESRIAELEAELARLRAAAVAGAHVLLRVLPPHSSFTHASRTVGTEPTPVPAHAVSEMTQAADRSGVKLQEG
jgi:hypothetical protein